ncbi:MAG TPA: HAD-IB family hydrolase, partial [Actinobacteria bacterium]|nr:HAD-IB family hydrolase [Actinomycetota bacterium]
MSAFPDTRIVLLVRGQGSLTGEARAREILTRPVFEPTRQLVGADALKRAFDERVEVLEGDLTTDLPAFPSDIDVVFHCAATVTFDPPIDEAFHTNLLGANRVYEAVAASGSRPHLVHVSTAYVAGLAKGVVP